MRFHNATSSLLRHRGFALPMTILAVAGMMITLIGLLSLITLERKTARSYADIARADFALQSGLADALATISPIACHDDTLVFRLESPQQEVDASATNESQASEFFTFGAQYQNAQKHWNIIPFVSGLKEFPSKGNRIDGEDVLPRLRTFPSEKIAYSRQHDLSIPRAQWVELPASDGHSDTVRFAWWVEDLQGKIDGHHAGTLARRLGLSPQEIGLFTLINDQQEKEQAGPHDLLIAQRDNLRSAASTQFILDEDEAKKIEPYITYSLPYSSRFQPLIPQGFDYPMAGQPAAELSNFIAQKNVAAIASHIEKNLPLFRDRRGGFPASEDYVKTLAASIIDYADPDNDPTIGVGYRGVDSYPFVNELFDRYQWTGTANGFVTVRVSTYVELWNPSNTTATGNFELENSNNHIIKIPPAATASFTAVVFPAQPVSIPANGFIVRHCGDKDYTFPVGAFPPSTLEFPVETKNSSYRMKWNGHLIDWARGGVTRTNGTLKTGTSNAKWKGHASPALDHSIGQHGDPRASYYINVPIFPNNYDANSNWGGRALKPSISNPDYREVKISRWPDRGSESKIGTAPGSDTKLPTTLTLPAPQSAMAPAFISNKPLQSLAEIGHVFDPAQWNRVETLGLPADSAGGGFTLAIGRPEFAVFDREGMRAAQLLDLFQLKSPTNAEEILPKININTAPRAVLRALVAGQILTNDPIHAGLYPPADKCIGDLFADAVLNSRKQHPLRGLSDLNLIRKDPLHSRNYGVPSADTEPFFGNPLVYPANKRPDNTWNDAGREELFERVSNLITFRSNTYRIIVCSQTTNSAGAVTSRRACEYHVQISPQRDDTGTILPNKPPIIKTVYVKNL